MPQPKVGRGNGTPRTHGVTGSPTYTAWINMRQRCTNPKSTAYRHYGGRGIRICDRWARFENFLADMGVRPAGLSLERRDNDGNYDPSNCMWATRSAQMKNRRPTAYTNRQRDNKGRFAPIDKVSRPPTMGAPQQVMA